VWGGGHREKGTGVSDTPRTMAGVQAKAATDDALSANQKALSLWTLELHQQQDKHLGRGGSVMVDSSWASDIAACSMTYNGDDSRFALPLHDETQTHTSSVLGGLVVHGGASVVCVYLYESWYWGCSCIWRCVCSVHV